MCALQIPLSQLGYNSKTSDNYHDHNGWISVTWKRVMSSDDSTLTLSFRQEDFTFGEHPKDSYNSEYLVPTLKQRGGSVTA
jgi:hypothetical protein